MTIDQIVKEVSNHRTVKRRQVLRYMKQLKIKPAGTIRQRPQQYPDETPKIILTNLGLRIVTMPQLRAERAKAQKARSAA